MNAVKIVAIVLLIAGVLGLLYGGFTYNSDKQAASFGSIQISVLEKKTVNVPIWASVGAIVIGGALLLFGSKRS